MQPKRRQKDRPRRSFFRPPSAGVSLPPDEVTGRRVPGPHKPKPSPLMGRGVEWRTSVSLPLEGKVPPKGADEVSPRSGVKPPSPPQRAISRPGASALFVSDGPISSNSGRNGGKNAGRNCVSALPQRATPVRCHPRFPSRNRRFSDRCRSADCASTAFRCRCPLLRQKLFVLPRRRLRNNYILCPTGTPTFAAARRQRRDLIIANPVEANTPTVAGASGRGSLRAGERRHSPFDRQ